MKTPLNVIGGSIVIVTALALTALTAQGQNLLSDPNFASGTVVPSGMGGWATFNGAQFSTAFTFGPTTFSMEDSGGGGFSVPGSFQYVAAQPGVSYLLTGYAYIPTALPGGTSEGFLQITFVDSTTTQNLGTVQTSPGNALVSNVVNSSSPTGTWIQLSEVATAPAGTAYAEPFTLVLDQNPTTVYFDDLSLTVVPEPSSFALAGLGLAAMLFVVRRRKMAASSAR
jgi:PEP-CTERM motif